MTPVETFLPGKSLTNNIWPVLIDSGSIFLGVSRSFILIPEFMSLSIPPLKLYRYQLRLLNQFQRKDRPLKRVTRLCMFCNDAYCIDTSRRATPLSRPSNQRSPAVRPKAQDNAIRAHMPGLLLQVSQIRMLTHHWLHQNARFM